MIITIVIKLLRVKGNPRDIRGEMSKRARENGTERKGWVAGGRTMGSRRVQAVGGVPGLEGMRVEQLG